MSRQEEQGDMCSICLGIPENTVRARCCRQIFCKVCIERCINTRGNSCPTCRRELLSTDLLPAQRNIVNLFNNMNLSEQGAVPLCRDCGFKKDSQIHDCIGNLVLKNTSILDELTRVLNVMEEEKRKFESIRDQLDLLSVENSQLKQENNNLAILNEKGFNVNLRLQSENEQLKQVNDDLDAIHQVNLEETRKKYEEMCHVNRKNQHEKMLLQNENEQLKKGYDDMEIIKQINLDENRKYNQDIKQENLNILAENSRLRYENAKLLQNKSKNISDLYASVRNSLDNYNILDQVQISSDEKKELIKSIQQGLLRGGDAVAARISSELNNNVNFDNNEYWHVIVGKSSLSQWSILPDKYLYIVFDEISIFIFTKQGQQEIPQPSNNSQAIAPMHQTLDRQNHGNGLQASGGQEWNPQYVSPRYLGKNPRGAGQQQPRVGQQRILHTQMPRGAMPSSQRN